MDDTTESEEIKAFSFEPGDLEACSKTVSELRSLFISRTERSGASVMAEPHYLLALAAFEQAACHLQLASYHQAQALAGRW